ncbi:sensor histidine kinase [Streptococcus cuniculipharyngis]|uniref:Sensor histidine kinase n=1 Tax=Streptococcus cuniculipharyngis TaxID=1562651 RepID=A0A5C5SB36_9STRE|nr:sensor histidine kinase [Streptococcus cuniculipharyngis]TWS98097.1 sensor histidine kinase [Streptococcus cuniculipharyngis]
MKKYYLFLFFFYAIITMCSMVFVILDSLGLDFFSLMTDWWILRKFLFSMSLLTCSLLILLVLLWVLVDDSIKRDLNQNLRRILNNQPISLETETEVDRNLQRLSNKVNRLTTNLQNTENAYILNSQEIVKQERKRIARDLHDTVSQELFASAMMISGLSQSLSQLSHEQLQLQLRAVEDVISSAQNDLRIMLLHLRPTELEGRTLSEGLDMILRELTDKSNIEVVYRKEVSKLPKVIEDNLFRIAQEFISNTLKHAQASRLEVYLIQTETEAQLKMVDNGRGFDMNAVRELSYGLTNIQERVDDLAGTMKFLSSPGNGVSMDVRLPIVKGQRNGEH